MNDDQQCVSNYITRRYGPGVNRAWWGIAHRRWLLDSGRYVRSGDQRSARAGMPAGLRVIGEAGPELAPLRGGGLLKGRPRQGDSLLRLYPHEYIFNPDGRVWRVGADGERIELIRGPREDDDETP